MALALQSAESSIGSSQLPNTEEFHRSRQSRQTLKTVLPKINVLVGMQVYSTLIKPVQRSQTKQSKIGLRRRFYNFQSGCNVVANRLFKTSIEHDL